MVTFTTLFLTTSCLVWLTAGYSFYRDEIPNGNNIPHPCVPGHIWEGVGHENPAGGGDRNPFGRDWKTNGMIWDECLCRTDSDGDGLTNGEELGDRDCVWTKGDTPDLTDNLSHPGICEPIESEECTGKNDWEVDCTPPGFNCDELDKAIGVENATVNISTVQIPAQVTTYMCQFVEFPSDGDYHIIATEPHIDNENILHHMILYGCPDEHADEVREDFEDPIECNMGSFLCPTMMVLWTVGYYGSCFAPEYGIRMGTHGFKYAILEIHYNNPDSKPGYHDGSGLLLHYTPHLRQYDGSTFFASPYYLQLAPNQNDVTEEGGCSGECTQYMFSEDIYIPEITPHMHYLGSRMRVEHRRNGELKEVLVTEDNYHYDSPKTYFFNPAVVVKPGDEIYVKCHFDTTGKDQFTFFGDGTFDEMCFATVFYYPLQANQTSCYVTNEIGYCGLLAGYEKGAECFDQLDDFFNATHGPLPDIIRHLHNFCDPAGLKCWPGCAEAIQDVRVHPCLHEDIEHMALNVFYQTEGLPIEFNLMMGSCDDRQTMTLVNTVRDDPIKLECPASTSETSKPYILGLLLLTMGTLFCNRLQRF